MAGATTRRASSRTTASSAPRASGSRDRTRTGPIRKSPFTAERSVYVSETSPPFSRDTTAWFVPRTTASSLGSTSTISTRSRAGPSLRTRRWTSTGWPTSARSRERDRTATTRGRTGGNNEPSARTMIGGRARSTSCQLRSASPARRSPSAAAARPLANGVRMSRHLRHPHLAKDVHVDVLDRGLEGAHLLRRRHRLDRGVVRPAFPSPLEHLDLLLAGRITHIDLQEEPVDLGLRERVRAFVLDRVLGRDHEERRVDADRIAFEGRLSFLHRLEESALRLRRRAVDLVRQEDVREDGAAPQHEVAGLPIEHVRPRDVRGQQIRGELHAPEREAKTRGKGFRDQRFREPRDVFNEDVAVAEDRPQHPFEDRSLAHDDGLDRVQEIPADVPDGCDVQRHASIRSRTP